MQAPDVSVLVAAYAAGVLMFFAPCSVGLLPAYLSYYSVRGRQGPPTATEESVLVRPGLLTGVLLFLVGAIPLFYMAVAGIRILLPGYEVIVSLARQGTGSYLPPVGLVVGGLGVMAVSLGRRELGRALRVGGFVTAGVVAVYLSLGSVVLLVGEWTRPYLLGLEIVVGPLLVLLGVAYYRGWSLSGSRTVPLPERDGASIPAFVRFGVLYGVGSLACNLPVFLGLVLSSFSTTGFWQGIAVFGAFSLGMGTLVVGATLVVQLADGSVSLGAHAGTVRRIGGVAFVAIGCYVTWFTAVSFELL